VSLNDSRSLSPTAAAKRARRPSPSMTAKCGVAPFSTRRLATRATVDWMRAGSRAAAASAAAGVGAARICARVIAL
jgi:hypothetical protein